MGFEPGKNMRELGIRGQTRFRVCKSGSFVRVGEIVELVDDDYTTLPWFKREGTNEHRFPIFLKDLEPINTIDISDMFFKLSYTTPNNMQTRKLENIRLGDEFMKGDWKFVVSCIDRLDRILPIKITFDNFSAWFNKSQIESINTWLPRQPTREEEAQKILDERGYSDIKATRK